MLLSPAPKPVRAWKQAGRSRHVHPREQAHAARLTRTGRAVRTWTQMVRQTGPCSYTGTVLTREPGHRIMARPVRTHTFTHMPLLLWL